MLDGKRVFVMFLHVNTCVYAKMTLILVFKINIYVSCELNLGFPLTNRR